MSATRTSLEQNAVNCLIMVWTWWPSSLVGTRIRALTSCSRTLWRPQTQGMSVCVCTSDRRTLIHIPIPEEQNFTSVLLVSSPVWRPGCAEWQEQHKRLSFQIRFLLGPTDLSLPGLKEWLSLGSEWAGTNQDPQPPSMGQWQEPHEPFLH